MPVKVVAQHLCEALVAPELAVEDVVIRAVRAEETREGGGVAGLHGGGEAIEETGEGIERVAHREAPGRDPSWGVLTLSHPIHDECHPLRPDVGLRLRPSPCSHEWARICIGFETRSAKP